MERTDLARARELLARHPTLTCAICGQGITVTSEEHGARPLLLWQEEGRCFSGCSAADRVVGKAAAMLYVVLQVSAVYADVMSESARAVLDRHHIEAGWDIMVPAIQNRFRSGLCPMERAVQEIEDPQQAPSALRRALHQLMQGEGVL